MSESQRGLAYELLQAGLSARGLENARNIMRLNQTIAELTKRFDEYESFLATNPIWLRRNKGIGVLDPADATVKVFFRGDNLYLGFDVRDQVVQYHPNFDRWDGFLVSLNEKVLRKVEDHNLQGRRLSFQVNANGTALAQNYLPTLIGAGQAGVAIALKPNTTVDTLGATADQGYTAEMFVDLKGLGYPAGLGDGTLWLGIDLLDGDSFLPTTDSYGTRTWWFREHDEYCCPAWVYMAASPPSKSPASRPIRSVSVNSKSRDKSS